MNKKKIAIVGAGITGLCTAWNAEKHGANIDLFDRKKLAGGVISTETDGEWRYELGPNTLLLKDPEIEALLEDLNLSERVETANSEASKRFIVKDGELNQLPQSLTGFLKTPLFSGKAKLRLLKEPFVSTTDSQSTVAHFFEARFGKEILDYAVNPFIAGIHAGRPDQLSIKHAFPSIYNLEQEHGSVMKGGVRKLFNRNGGEKTKRRLISFETGLHELPEKLTSGISNTFYDHDLERAEKQADGWYLQTNRGEYGPYDDVVITIPLHKWDSKKLPISSEQLKKIKGVSYPPLSTMVLGYRKKDIEHPLDGFGFLVPEVENRSILGALFTSTLFKNRAPEDYHLLTVFAGGGRQPGIAEMESSDLLKLVQEDLKDLIGVNGEPVFKDHIFWPNSIPQYNTGYNEIYSIFEELESNNVGLHFAGNFRRGISVPDCIKNGLTLGKNLANAPN
ncbi:protoporphyrinogen oxidase [Rhodohalobacter sp. 8-1]|uniref:protoporphyrinogen oxidase n=1 Tax=Rhodohalobacter sp. 8-1 TaxID=3131972 RepID=UPI0030EEDEBE